MSLKSFYRVGSLVDNDRVSFQHSFVKSHLESSFLSYIYFLKVIFFDHFFKRTFRSIQGTFQFWFDSNQIYWKRASIVGNLLSLKSVFSCTNWNTMRTRQVSTMIHSARPTVTPVANIVFCCFVLLDLKSGDGRTTCAKTMIPTGRGCGLASGSIGGFY